MSEKRIRAAFQAPRERLSEALHGAGDLADRGSQAVRDAVSAAIRDPRAVGIELWDRISACVDATWSVLREAGGQARDRVRGAMLGAIHGATHEHAWATETVEKVSAALVRHAIKDGEDVFPVVQEIMESAVDAAREIGFSAEEAAAAAARGALRAGGEHGSRTRRAVRDAIPRSVRDVRVPETTLAASSVGEEEGRAS
jgi:hypothetical protein